MVSYKDLYVVGMGASAGGFEAFQKFIPNMSQSKDIAYIIAQHLDPKRPTLFGELLSKCSTFFELKAIVEGDIIEAQHIYYCPPGKDVTIKDGHFHLSEPENKAYPKPSINKFFTSLAIEKGKKAIGIILSGTGSDGAKGVAEIARLGGIALTEDEGAKYYSMPKAAIDTGCVVESLPPELLAEGIVHLIKDKNYFEKHFELQSSINKIFDLLNKETNIDFSAYKEATITRRIKKRTIETKVDGIEQYLELLESNHEEVEKLKDELLIIVTSFFRDKDAFDMLQKELLKLIAYKEEGDIRIWVPACATGEEAYTIAMIVSELLEKLKKSNKVTIFATDVSERTVKASRKRTFTQEQVNDIDTKYLDKYFEVQNNIYQPTKAIRSMITFSKHDLIKDPPFLNLDLVSCRNVLIYFNAELQKRVLSIFYYVLRFEAILFLGMSETIGSLSSLFVVADNKFKIYKKSNDLSMVDIKNLTYVKKNNLTFQKTKKEKKELGVVDIDFAINKALSNHYSPNGVVIDGVTENILFYKGDTKEYFEQPSGVQTIDVYRLLKDYLKFDFRIALNDAMKSKGFVQSKKIRVISITEQKVYVILNIFALQTNRLGNNTYFITFVQEVDTKQNVQYESSHLDAHNDEVALLEDELANLKEKLQITIEELETSNEELQSTNEELQTTNEELETSNEELRSINEEIQTLNDELNFSNEELEFVNKAFDNVLVNLDSYVLILDKELNIIKYTDGIIKFFDISKSDDRNLSTLLFNSTINLPNLMSDIKEVFLNNKKIGYDVAYNNRHYYFRIRKINISAKNFQEGIALSFIDKTELVKKEQMLAQQSKMAAMGEMIGNIAHQWRQPLNALSASIIGMILKIHMGQMQDEDLVVFKDTTNKLIQNMSTTIDDFRRFFLPNKEKKKFYVANAIKDSLKFVADAYRDNSIEIETHIDADISLLGYHNELVQVLLNILNNSKDAMKTNHIKNAKVEISTQEDSEGVKIIISDNGGGVDEKIINKIFEPYFTTKFEDQGTGLGLYMSKMIVEESMRGKLTMQNGVNGLQSTIYLPKDSNVI